MAHWTEQYLALDYVEGEFDCADLAVKIMKEQAGVTLSVPSDRQWRNWTPGRLYDQFGTGFVQVHRPTEYDVALMGMSGTTRREFGGHIGVVSLIGFDTWVIHSMKGAGVVFEEVRRLWTHRLEVKGFYRWQR